MKNTVVPKSASAAGTFPEAVVRHLSEYEASDFESAHRILEILKRQKRTASGFPRIRPPDCDRLVLALETVFKANRSYFRSGDEPLIRRFDEIVDAAADTDIAAYPWEFFRLRLLQGEIKILLGDIEGVRSAIGHFTDRPYAAETDMPGLARLFKIDGQLRMICGKTDGIGKTFLDRAIQLARFSPFEAWRITRALAPFIPIDNHTRMRDGLGAFVFARLLRAAMYFRHEQRWQDNPLSYFADKVLLICAGCYLFLIGLLGDIRFVSGPRHQKRETIVTRAMGGIGDFLMMTPGLRALARKQGRPVKFAIPKKFFPIFANNPSVDLVDMDSEPIDLSSFALWRNLTICPAAAYESIMRPYVRKGRVELFARGMGIRRAALDRHGWNIEVNLDSAQATFRHEFLKEKGFGKRALIGVVPFSREIYRDHPGILDIIRKLGDDYDVIAFHHLQNDALASSGIASTAGLTLSQSLALVSALDIMVSVDSGFLQAAVAFGVPIVALFGPTDVRSRVLPDYNAIALTPSTPFPCAPCWRNEDLPCLVTGNTGISPCIAAIAPEAVMRAVAGHLRHKSAHPAPEGHGKMRL